ncbi:MAG: hypothetical protein CUN53_01220 [Phototrophicales bacterium]|nr:MAG: hypothetical protein CUN53_01220 [Phototrophicales bacterium]
MELNAKSALQAMTLHTDGEAYRFIRLPSSRVTAAAGVLAEISDPFLALIVDKDEITLVLPEVVINDYTKRLGEHSLSDSAYRLITFDIELNHDLIGFTALVSTALEAAGVPLMPLAAFSRDHILVPADHFQTAWNALEKLKAGQ